MFTFGELHKGFRKRAGITQEELGDLIGRGRNTIGAWERSDYLPNSRDLILKIADELSLSPDETDQLLYAADYPLEYNTPSKYFLDIISSHHTKSQELNTERTEAAPVSDKSPSSETIIVSLTVVYLAVVIFIFLPIWIQSCKTCFLNDYETLYLVIPLVGAWFGFGRLRGHYRLIHSIPAPFILFCLALLLFSSGNMIWTYYNFVEKVKVPYPSLADVSYFSHNLLWLVGVCMLLNHLGANVRRKTAVLWWIGGILLVSLIMIMLFVRGWKLDLATDPLKFAFDVAYPLVSGFTVALMALQFIDPSFKQLNGTMKKSMRIIFLGTFLLFIADVSFNLVTSLPNTYYDGMWPDFIYATALYVLGTGVLLTPLEITNQIMTGAQLRAWIGQPALRAKRWFGEVLHLDYIFFVKKSL